MVVGARGLAAVVAVVAREALRLVAREALRLARGLPLRVAKIGRKLPGKQRIPDVSVKVRDVQARAQVAAEALRPGGGVLWQQRLGAQEVQRTPS